MTQIEAICVRAMAHPDTLLTFPHIILRSNNKENTSRKVNHQYISVVQKRIVLGLYSDMVIALRILGQARAGSMLRSLNFAQPFVLQTVM